MYLLVIGLEGIEAAIYLVTFFYNELFGLESVKLSLAGSIP